MTTRDPLEDRNSPGFSLTQLQAFSTVAETLSYVEAAVLLGYSEPAVHHQVKRLEAALGCTLIEKSGRALRLTEEGERLLPQCLVVIREAALLVPLAMNRRLPDMLSLVGGRLTSAYILPDVIAEVQRLMPSLQIDLQSADRFEVVQRVRSGEADIGISGHLDQVVDPGEFTIAHLWDTEFHLFESSTTPLPPADHSRFDERTIYALGPMNASLAAAVAAVSALRITARVVFVPTVEAVKGMCLAGLGWSFLRKDSAKLEMKTGLLRPTCVFPQPVSTSVWAIQSKGRSAPPAAEQFMDITTRRSPQRAAFAMPGS